MIADHGDHVVEHDDLAHAGEFDRGAVVDLADLAAEHGAGSDGCELHAGQDRVNAVDGLAVDLVRRVEPLQGLADDNEVLGVLDRDILRRRLALRGERHRAIAELAAARGMRDLALRGRAACGLDTPLAGCGLHQHRARGGAGLAQRRPPGTDRVGVAGRLQAESRIAVELVVRRRVLDLDLAPVGVELFGEHRRDRGVGALAHLDLRHDQDRAAGLVDADEGVRCELAVGRVNRLHRLVDGGAQRQMEGEQETGGETAS
ncbi:hypothetical protein ACVW1A_003777 [Bradyrhizobium sp. LB1.3]